MEGFNLVHFKMGSLQLRSLGRLGWFDSKRKAPEINYTMWYFDDNSF